MGQRLPQQFAVPEGVAKSGFQLLDGLHIKKGW
jgi:hypothetical protein